MLERPKKNKRTSTKRNKRYKVVVVGDAGVGKTSLVSRYCSDKFENEYRATIAVDYQNKQISQDKESVMLNFWDFSGHSEFYEVRNEFYRDTNAMILVMDLNIKSSLHGLDMWIREANDNGIEPEIPLFVVGNKKDKSRSISEQEGFSWANQRKIPYFEISCMNNDGFELLFTDIVNKLLKQR